MCLKIFGQDLSYEEVRLLVRYNLGKMKDGEVHELVQEISNRFREERLSTR
jgi:hypothetical protein